jgi:hypothetical protein
MSVAPNAVPACTTKQVSDAHIGLRTHDGVCFAVVQPTTDGKPLCESRVTFFLECVLPFIWPKCPSMLAECPSCFRCGAAAFAKNILGPEACETSVHVSHNELCCRMAGCKWLMPLSLLTPLPQIPRMPQPGKSTALPNLTSGKS